MKKLSSLLLALALVFSLAAAPAWAEKEYGLTIAGTKVTDSNAADILGNGVFAYDAAAKKLTVRGSCACQYDPVINSEIPGLTVSAEQNVTLSSESDVIHTYKDMTITGSGVLTLKSTGNSCIYPRADVVLFLCRQLGK